MLCIMITLSAVVAFCATSDIDIDISQANKLARNVSFKTWNTYQINPQSVILIEPTYPSPDSLKITITNPRFTQKKDDHPLLFSVQLITDGVETDEVLRAKVTCPERPGSNLPALCSMFLYSSELPDHSTAHMAQNYQPFFSDLYACTPQKTVGETVVNVIDSNNLKQAANITTVLPNDTHECAHRILMTMSLDKGVFPFEFRLFLQKMDFGVQPPSFVDIYPSPDGDLDSDLDSNPYTDLFLRMNRGLTPSQFVKTYPAHRKLDPDLSRKRGRLDTDPDSGLSLQ